MKILLIGATGMIGAKIATEAGRRGHPLTGVSRSGGEGIEAAEASDTARIAQLAAGHDAVVMAVSTPLDDAAPLLAAGASIVEATRTAGVRRLVVVGGAGGLLLPDGGRVVDAPWFPEDFKTVALAHVDLLELIRDKAGDLDWTYISPPPLIQPGERIGHYTSGGDQIVSDSEGTSTISVEDYALALLDELEQGANIGSQMTVAYT